MHSESAGRVLTTGLVLAVAAVALQTIVHLINAVFFQKYQLDANNEGTPLAWASVVATFAVAFAATVAAVVSSRDRPRFAALGALAAFFSLDDMVEIHERLGVGLARRLGLPDYAESFLFPALYLPLLAVTFVLVITLVRSAPARVRTFAHGGLALLVLALVAEAASGQWATADDAYNPVHVVESAFEEGAELGGWILIAAAMTTVMLSVADRADESLSPE